MKLNRADFHSIKFYSLHRLHVWEGGGGGSSMEPNFNIVIFQFYYGSL